MDDAEPNGNGIVCSGSMAANDPLCTEQFENSQVASLKVVPEAGHVFTGWILNGAHITLASAEPLFLSTMPLLAGDGPFTQCTQETEAQASCPMVQINTDSNNDGTIDAQDELVEETSRKMVDYQDTTARIPVQLLAEALDNLNDTFSLEVAASSGGSHLLIWESESATEPLPLPANYGLDALPSALYVSGCKTSDCGPGEATLELRLVQQQNGTSNTVLSDNVLFTVMDMAHIGGGFRIIGYEDQAEYEMELTEEPDGIETFFRTLGGMRLHLSALALPDIEVEEYSWSADQGKFLGSYEMTAAELTGDALKGAELTDMYWEGEYTPNLDVTVTLRLKIQGETTPHSVTRRIKSRELSSGTEGDDVRMLQAFLRSIGISQKGKYGYRGEPVVVDGDFGSSTNRAVNRFRKYDQIGETGTIDTTALDKIKAHNTDYLIAFGAFKSAPQVIRNHADYSDWLQGGALILATTYTSQVQQAIGQEVTPEKILDAFVQKETRNFGHWGYRVDYRISLSEDGYGSIGFSQILGKYKFGSNPAAVLNSLNLYRPDDAIKIIAQWNNQEGGFNRAFVQKPSPYQQTDSYSQENRYPRIGNLYVDNKRDLLSKAIMAYNRGPKSSYYSLAWPEMLRQYLPPVAGTDFGQRTAINYSLLMQKFLVEELDNFSWRSWEWTSQRIVSRKSGICNIVAHSDDEQLIASGTEVQEGDILISPGRDGVLNTQLNTSEQNEQALIEEFSFDYSEEQWLYDKDNGKAGVSWADVLLEEVHKKN